MRRQWQDLSSILKELRRSEKWGRHLSRHPAFRVWEKAVGEAIASVARPIGVKGGCLQVDVADSAWLQELQLMAGEILAKLNAELEEGELEEIRFRLGSAWKAGERDESRTDADSYEFRCPVDLSAEDEKAVREMIRGFRDEELRDNVERLLGRVHSWTPASAGEERNAMKLEERG